MESEYSLEFFVAIAHWLTGIGTVVLAIELIKTFKHLDATTKMSKVETEYRLRPWIGPSSGITRMTESINGDIRFSVQVKNFGDLPATNVKAKSIVSKEPLTKESLGKSSGEFSLGPLLPHMEKNYWIFITPEMWEGMTNSIHGIYLAVYFEYPSLTGTNGYGMISEYNKSSDSFVHKEMWLDGTALKPN